MDNPTMRRAIPWFPLLLLGCQLPPSAAADARRLTPDAGPRDRERAEAEREVPDLDPPSEAGLDPALRQKIFAEVHAYLTAEDPGPKPALLDKLDGEYAGLPYALFAEAVRARPAPVFAKTGLHQGVWTDPQIASQESYHVYLPPKLAASAADRFPLIVFLHGAGGTSAGIAGSQSFQAAADRLGAILLAPQNHTGWNWAWNEDEMSQVVLLVQLIKRRYPVDDTRVVLSGFSMGGWGSMSIGAAYPDPYCGLVPVAGSVGAVFNSTDLAVHKAYCCPHMENLGNLRFHYLTGAEDMALMLYQNRACELCLKELGSEYVYSELPGVGHVFLPDLWEAAVAWTLARPRVPYPTGVAYNLAAQASADPPGFKWFQQELRTPQYWAELESRLDPSKPARLEAKRVGNQITLGVKNLSKASLFLAPEMVDPASPVTIVDEASGAILQKRTLALDRRLLLTEARRRSDRSAIFSDRIDLSFP
jgi:predicted esterase